MRLLLVFMCVAMAMVVTGQEPPSEPAPPVSDSAPASEAPEPPSSDSPAPNQQPLGEQPEPVPLLNVSEPAPQSNSTDSSNSTEPEVSPEPLLEPEPSSQSNITEPVPDSAPVPSNATAPSNSTGPEMAPSPGAPSPTPDVPIPSVPISVPVPSFSGACANIVETTLKGTINDALSQEIDDEIDIIGTVDDHGYITLYRSDDGGVTWNDLTPNFPGINEPSSKIITRNHNTGVLGSYWSSVDPYVGYVINYNGRLYVTKDGGATFTSSTPIMTYNFTTPYNDTIEWVKIIPHPYEAGWLVAESFSPSCYSTSPLFDRVHCPIINRGYALGYSLSFSKDYGTTWTNIFASEYSVAQGFTWGPAGRGNFSNETAYAIIGLQGNLVVVNTSTLFANYRVITPPSIFVTNMLWYSDTNTLLLAGVQEETYNLYGSTNGSGIVKSRFPGPQSTLDIVVISILDTSEGSAFVAIFRYGGQTDRGDLYVSDLLGSDFTLSLPSIAWNLNSYQPPVFVRLRVEGIFLVNRFVGADKRTVITYDKGGEWWPLNPPVSERCSGCSLHLWGPPVLNPNFNVLTAGFGVIVANGNVGTAVVANAAKGNLYLSRDAGISWSRVLNGTYVIDITEYGEFLVALDWQNPTKSLQYTFTQGLDWNMCGFQSPENPAQYAVRTVSVDLGEDSSSVWIEASKTINGSLSTSLFYVNFTRVLPNCTADDYELFQPQAFTQECILGTSTTYRRKKRTAQCTPDPALLKASNVSVCPCRRSDYFCVYCFVTDANRTCVLDTSNPACTTDPGIPSNCPAGTSLQLPSVYRKVVGSQCYGDVPEFHMPRTVVCSGDSALLAGPQITGWVILGVALGLVIIGLLIFGIYHLVKYCTDMEKFDRFQDTEQTDLPTMEPTIESATQSSKPEPSSETSSSDE